MEINKTIAEKVLETVDQGLVRGLGKPIPGKMCVEAAVCYAMGLPHSNNPSCVAPSLRSLKIFLNDKSWSSKESRAKGLRRLALIQLGSKDNLDEKEFIKQVIRLVIKKYLPIALQAAIDKTTIPKNKEALIKAMNDCKEKGTKESADAAYHVAYAAAYAAHAAAYHAAAYAAHAAAYAAYAAYHAAHAAYAAAHVADAATDNILAEFAEDVVQILVEMNVPGVQWLELAPLNS